MGVVESFSGASAPFTAPRPLHDDDHIDGFDCGKLLLDEFIKSHAKDSEGKSARTYVVCATSGPDAGSVVAYYTLANGAVARKEMPSRIRHGLPNPAPVMVLGRLAVDRRYQGKRIGPFLLREAMQRTLEASKIAGLRALVVHAIDDSAVSFYASYDFQMFPAGSRTMFLPIETLAAAL